MVEKIEDEQQRYDICFEILHELPDWFANEGPILDYSMGCREMPVWADMVDGKARGFIALKETSPYAAELCVMGVRPEYHRSGIGRKLFEALYAYAKEQGYEFLQVKTVREGMYEDYDRTNAFYRSVGFKELECLPDHWDEANPCQIFVMALR